MSFFNDGPFTHGRRSTARNSVSVIDTGIYLLLVDETFVSSGLANARRRLDDGWSNGALRRCTRVYFSSKVSMF